MAVGASALATEDTKGQNVAIGYRALNQLNCTSNASNVAIGYQSGDALTSGTHVDNTSIDISTAHTSVVTTMNTNSFAAGDAVGVAIKRSAGTAAQVVLTIAWEYTL